MAAAVAPGNPAPAAAPAAAQPAAETVDAGTHGLAAVLGDLTAEDAEPKPAPTEGDPAETEATEAEPADAAQKLDDEVIFSDEALETKEGIQKARARVRELRKKGHETYLGLKKYDARLQKKSARIDHKVNEFVTEKRNYDLVMSNMRATVANARSGKPELMVQALGQMYGMDGIKALEILNSELINQGKSALDPQLRELVEGLRGEIAQLKGGLGERDLQEKKGQLTQKIDQHRQSIGAHINTNAEQLPHLARALQRNPKNTIEYIVDEITERHAAGLPVDKATYFVQLEAELAEAFTGVRPAAKAEGGDPAPKQSPPTVQRSPGQSVGPRTTAASTPRVPSEDEALRALSQDEALMSSLFG